MDGSVMGIRDAVQLFVDDSTIRASKGLERCVHPFEKVSIEPMCLDPCDVTLKACDRPATESGEVTMGSARQREVTGSGVAS